MRNKLLFSIAMVVMSLTLQGCVLALIGGVAAGESAITHPQTVKIYYIDSNIKFAIDQRLRDNRNLRYNTHLVSAVYEGVVLLAGQVVDPNQRDEAENSIRDIPNIKRIYNKITVSGVTTTLTRSSDLWITSEVKSVMLVTKKLHSRRIKIMTENGVVYLMGQVTSQQANLAANVTRRVSGVQRVVTLFEIEG